MSQELEPARDLLAFIDASPSPFHCVATSALRLEEGGFVQLHERNAWKLEFGKGYYVVRSGALIAFRLGSKPVVEAGFRLVGAHTDSPNLRLKPNADYQASGYAQVGVETYGGLLAYTWLDRDLGVAGRVALHGEAIGTIETRLVDIRRPLFRIPSLAIHLNRDIRTEGLKLNNQTHLPPLLGLASGDGSVGAFEALLAEELEVEVDQILSWDLGLMDLQASTLGGFEDAFVFAPRLDNQASCHAGITALLKAGASDSTALVALYDHEEVGSGSTSGAAGSFVEDIMTRISEVEGPGALSGGLQRAVASSFQVSADMAHAVHPNYSEKHEPRHLPKINEGPVIKINAQQRYATDSVGEAIFEALCQRSEIPYQKFVTRTDLACGSTIGPLSASRLGVPTVDVGNPMLSMHSIREQSGSQDVGKMIEVLTRLFTEERLS